MRKKMSLWLFLLHGRRHIFSACRFPSALTLVTTYLEVRLAGVNSLAYLVRYGVASKSLGQR